MALGIGIGMGLFGHFDCCYPAKKEYLVTRNEFSWGKGGLWVGNLRISCVFKFARLSLSSFLLSLELGCWFLAFFFFFLMGWGLVSDRDLGRLGVDGFEWW